VGNLVQRISRISSPLIVSLVILLASVGSASAFDPIGTWYTAGKRAQVRIGHCGHEKLCGGIVWLKEPNNPKNGKPWTDVNNPEPAKRNRPLVGVPIVLDMIPSNAPNRWQGKVYNADDGKTYSGYVTMTGPSALELKGCVLAGIICKSETWMRAR
jgi:uncharacterized protein (DUF2147 family)